MSGAYICPGIGLPGVHGSTFALTLNTPRFCMSVFVCLIDQSNVSVLNDTFDWNPLRVLVADKLRGGKKFFNISKFTNN